MGIQFDIDWQNFGLGYGAGILTGYAVYQSRHLLRSIRRGLSSQANSAQSFATMGGDRRYTNELTQYALHSHLFHKSLELSDILIEPRFIPDREVAITPDEENERRNPFETVPIIPDHPYLHQPYHINTISVEELGYGERAIALLGVPGSGETTALHAIALWSMGKLDFDKPDDPVQQRIKDEEARLSRQERDERAKATVAIEQRAREQLREELGADVGEEVKSAFIPPFRQMAPIYVHLANVRLGNRDWRGNVDPAEPLIRAVQYQAGSITSKTAPRKIYRFLNEGVCLILVDGLEELPIPDQRQKIAWLHALLDEYNKNFIIVSSPATGYGALQQIGFSPVHLRPWSYQDTKTYVRKLSHHWGDIVKQRRVTIEEDIQQNIVNGLWGLNPFEITIKTRSQFIDGVVDSNTDEFFEWTQDYVTSLFEDAEDALPMMGRIAAIQIDKHYFTLNDWVEIEIAQAAGTVYNKTASDKEVEAIKDSFDDDFGAEFGMGSIESDEDDFSEFEDAEVDNPTFNQFVNADETSSDEIDGVEDTPKNETTEARQIRRNIGKLMTTLQKAGLIERYQGNRYRFRHTHIASFLASQTLINSDPAILVDKALNPDWSQAMAYTASQANIGAAVEAKMSTSPDILLSNILDVANWLRYADDLAEWRNKYLTYLGQMFVAPSQYLTGRERIAAAIVTTRDINTKKIFARGAKHNNEDVKRLSILGLGIFQDADLLDNLSYFFDAQTEEVRVAAALAIGNIHNEDAYTLLSEELLHTNSESVQQAIAETFADNPEVGYEILWEILNSDEYKDRVRLRRAAILGVKRLRTDWSLIEIYRTYVEDQQWYVKSTAQLAFTERQSQRNKGVQPYPQITTLPWLREWSLNLQDESATEASGIELLNMAMRESDPVIRYLATSNSGQLGVYENTQDIYNLLNDQEDAIRDTAYRSLVDIQMRIGQPLPIPR